jgi:ribosomal protein S24E
MFDDRWRICCRSQNSAGKGPSRHHISEDQENSRKIPKNYILPKNSGSQKEEAREARG